MIGEPINKLMLSDFDEHWAEYFDIECQNLKKIIGGIKYICEHIGSTSIENMRARPIIDMIIGVGNEYDLITVKDVLSINGYTYDLKKSTMNVHSFHRDADEKRYFNIIVTKYGSKTWKVYTGIRDYLASHPDKAKEYETLKLDLFLGVEGNKGRYENLKRTFIQDEVLPKINLD